MDFGDAVRNLKIGRRVSRAGWNGKGMWLSLTEGRFVESSNFWSQQNRDWAASLPANGAEVLPYITMKTADGKIVPWLASQTDVLAEDWNTVDGA